MPERVTQRLRDKELMAVVTGKGGVWGGVGISAAGG